LTHTLLSEGPGAEVAEELATRIANFYPAPTRAAEIRALLRQVENTG
jgi:hypothetical protein